MSSFFSDSGAFVGSMGYQHVDITGFLNYYLSKLVFKWPMYILSSYIT